MTKRKHTLVMFDDIRLILDQCLAEGGGTITLANRAQAVRWRQRFYTFRRLWREERESSGLPYDRLTISYIKPDDTSGILHIRPNESPIVSFQGAGKGPISVSNARPIDDEDDDLLAAAKGVAKGMGLDDGGIL